MHVATAALSLLLVAPTLAPAAAPSAPGGHSLTDGEGEVTRRAYGLLLRRARTVAAPFLAATSRDDLHGILAEALDDSDLLDKLAAFDDIADALLLDVGPQPLDREALVSLVGEDSADRIVLVTPLDQALQKALEQIRAEALVGVRHPSLGLFLLSPEETAQLPGRLMQLLLDHWKGKLIAATLVAVLLGNESIRGWRADALYETLARGKRATLTLLASMDVTVPEALAPTSERVDLDVVIRRDHGLQQRLAHAPSFDPSDPDASVVFPPTVA